MNNSNVESDDIIDRLTSDINEEYNRSGIVLERRPKTRSLGIISKILGHWSEHHVKYTSVATFLGIIFAFSQLSLSVKHFEEQMNGQRETTSSQVVSDFFRQVGDMTAIASTRATGTSKNKNEVERFIVSRAQMLIDSEQTREFRNDIVRFLGANGYGIFIGSKPKENAPGINLNSANLSEIRIYGANFSSANFFCLGFMQAYIDRTDFIGADINNTDFTDSIIGNVNFSKATMRKVSFNGVKIIGLPNFEDASILNSDIRGLKLESSFLHGLAQTEGDTSPEGILRVKNLFFVELFSQAKSLTGTKMDPDLYMAFEQNLGAKRFSELTMDSAASMVMSNNEVPSAEVADYRASCKEAPIDSA